MKVIKTKNKFFSIPYERVDQWSRLPLFIISTITIFLVLKYSFLAYVGLLDPKGDYSLPILQKFDLIQIILYLLVYPTSFILNFIGFNTLTTFNSVKIIGSGGVKIAFACLGIEIMFSLIALILAYPGRNKIQYIIMGIVGVHTINIFRVTALALLKHFDTDMTFPGHDLFNLICYSFIISVFYWWVKNYSSDLLLSSKKNQR